MAGPLTGVRLLEIGAIGPGPFAGMLFADMGAEVVRVDRPAAGSLRNGSPDPAFDLLNRGRRSITVDLKAAEGRELVLDLVARADVLIEGFRPGVAERLGIGPDECHARNERLVYGRITGWGQDGPLADSPGHDINYIALSGILSVLGYRDQPPVPPLNLLGDFGGGGMTLAFGLLCALLEARRSGRGQVVDAAMLDGSALLSTIIHAFRAEGTWREERQSNLLDGGAHFYGSYQTADGGYVAIGAIEPQFYAELLRLLGLGDADLPDQHDHSSWSALRERVASVFRTRTRDQWCELMEGSDACFAPVLSMAEAPDHPHNAARRTFIEVDGVVQPAPAPRFSRTPGAIAGPPARPGEHTNELLRELGLDRRRIADLHAAGIVRGTTPSLSDHGARESPAPASRAGQGPPTSASPVADLTDDRSAERMAELLQPWAQAHAGSAARAENVRPMPGNAGISFGFDLIGHDSGAAARQPLVIRVPPRGVRRSGNTDVLRQAPLLQALGAASVPVPPVRWYGDDQRWFGVPYLIVERLPGTSLSIFDPDPSFDLRPTAVKAIFRQAIDALIATHQLDWRTRLSEWEKPRSLTDEIARWEDVLRKGSNAAWITEGIALRDRLLLTRPAEPEPGLVHGDFYSNNWVISEGSLQAIVDWEIASLGPSLLDLGWLCTMYDPACWGPRQQHRMAWAPRVDDIISWYEQAWGAPAVDIQWYRALAGYRLASITSLNVRLHRSGRRPDPVWELLAEAFPYLVERSHELLSRAAQK